MVIPYVDRKRKGFCTETAGKKATLGQEWSKNSFQAFDI